MIFCDDDDMDISSFCVKHDMTHAHFNMNINEFFVFRKVL